MSPPTSARPVPDLIVIRFGEVFLKGGNRHIFMNRLRGHLERAIAGTGWRLHGTHVRCYLRPDPAAGPDEPPPPVGRVLDRVCRVFGVVSASPALETTTDPADIAAKAVALAAATVPGSAKTFRVRSRRSDKTLPYTSTELNQQVGHAVGEVIGLPADLRNPDFDVGVEAGADSFVFTERHPGPGGLPVGASGRVHLLLSGGIDSPVAGWMAMKRGCRVDGVYFHSFPLVGDGALEKVRDLATTLATYGGPMKLHVVPFADAQVAIRDACPPRLLVLLYRRLMFRIADRIARAAKAKGLVTGESLGQVASQTLENLAVIGSVTRLPILRPLIGFDKEETIARARAIGTFETSIQAHIDCCSLFVPKHPETKGRPRVLEQAEEALDMDALVAAAVEGTRVETIG